jgi:peptidoglycan hydrolase-like protein with peptidoglycan-binding domain
LLLVCASALVASEYIGYTTIHKSAIDLRFWKRWSRESELPAPEQTPRPAVPEGDSGPQDDRSHIDDHVPEPSDGRSETDPDSGVGEEPPERPSPSFLCSCEYEARVLELRTPYMAGDDIESLQTALRILGYYSGPADGIYSGETAEAVKRLQRSQSLAVDGVVGKKTVDAIGALIYRDVPDNDLMSVAEFAAAPVGPSARPVNPIIVIDIDARRLTVYSEGKPFKSYPVAVGKPSTPTPVGNWKIVNKGVWGGGFGTRWMGLSIPWGRYGIHGTNRPGSIGTAASHGCIRMLNSHVEELYNWVGYGTPVKIISGGFGDIGYYRPNLSRGATGAAVKEVQCQLRDFGYYKGGLDGIYGYQTEQAVKSFQKDNGLEQTGAVDQRTYDALGIILMD